MLRRRLAYLVPLALMLPGSLAAHGLAYRLADPGPYALSSTGHGYLDLVPLLLGAALALALLGLAGEAAAAFAGRKRGARPRLHLAFLPPAGFALQEHLERYLHTGEWPVGAPLEATFLVGLALQLPLALAALLAARLLLDGAHGTGEALAVGPGRPRLVPHALPALAAVAAAPRAAFGPRPNPPRGPPRRS